MTVEVRELWLEVLWRFRQEGWPDTTLRLWIEPGWPEEIQDRRLVVSYPEKLFAWTAKRYRVFIGEIVRDVRPDLLGIRIKKQPLRRLNAAVGGNDG